ncbi:hypothetical protein RYZ26_02040 [Terasakiella sp. A23]|uniref:hypothetical protein n=1 Tax=Terasakiella sp. FCG-A23 TaxID=3080561 RepID=UPI0029557952|nr:hypothetical protein [Terasakiella sp. A23]MDV7338359.1 hypothetical protein [Terasakiella sp. A23]
MKYLIFNACVFLALGYLIAGGEPKDFTDKMEQGVHKAKAHVQEMVEQPKQRPVVKQEIPPLVEKAKPAPKLEPVREVVEKQEPKEPVVTAPPPMPEPVQVAKAEPKKIPSRRLERDVEPAPIVEAPVEEVVEQETSEEPDQQLVDVKARSRELRQMVADMEQMFAEKMTR